MNSYQHDSTNTLNNDDHNGSFEDDDIDDEHVHSVDNADSRYPQKLNSSTTIKACVLYDFNGKNLFPSRIVSLDVFKLSRNSKSKLCLITIETTLLYLYLFTFFCSLNTILTLDIIDT